MNKTVTIVLAIVLMVIVMTISVILFFTGAAAREKWDFQEVWTASFSGAESMKIIDLTGDKVKDVFLQSQSEVAILDAQGQKIWSATYQSPPATTMGDFNGDDTDDFVVIYQPPGESVTATAYTGQGQELWTRALPNFGEPSRATSVDFQGDRVREIVAGDMNGYLLCLSSQGEIVWEYNLPSPTSDTDAYVRGLDDVSLAGTTAVAVANYAGQVVLLDGQGQPLWAQKDFPERLRRLRAYDLDGDGSSEVILGGEYGSVWALGGNNGERLWSQAIGQRVQEIRDVEVDGDPATTEVAVGGREGSLVVYSHQGQKLMDASPGGKLSEIASIDLDDDGRNEVLVGNDEGKLAIYDHQGNSLQSKMFSGEITRLDTGKLTAEDQFAVAAGSEVSTLQMEMVKAPFWYNTLVAGFIACLAIAAGAWAITNITPAPKLQYSAEDMTIEGLRAKRKMYLESLHELKKAHQAGEVPAESYLARSKELREQVSQAEAEMMRLGASIKPEMMKCPNCGGSIELGSDKCEYCGQTVI
jgi:outer membrane protein assembly factor BamB